MATCLEYSVEQITACTSWGQSTRTGCALWGTTTRTSCSSWGIFSFVCVVVTTIIEWTCLVFELIFETVCLVWATSALTTCVLWEVVTTIAGAVFDVVEAVLGWLFSGVAAIVDLVFSIPYFGRVLKWLWNGLITLLVTAPVTIGEGVLYFLGLRPQKKLRICVVVARDESGNPVVPVGLVVTMINDAIAVFRNRLNIQILNSAPAQFSSGFSTSGPSANASWVKIADGPWPTVELDGACSNATPAGFNEDLTVVGSARQFKLIAPCYFGEWRRISGFGAPVVVIVQRSIGGGLFAGCALGPLTDYVTLAATSTPGATDANNDDVADTIALAPGPTTFVPPPSPNSLLAHELGHKCNLWHIFVNPANLMTPSPGNADGLDDCRSCWCEGRATYPICRRWQLTTFAPGALTPEAVPDTLVVAGKELKGFSRLPPARAMSLRLQVIEAAHECGCRWGAGVAGVAVWSYVGVSLLVPLLCSEPATFSWPWALGVLLAGMLLGKAFGTFRAQRALNYAIAEFHRAIEGSSG